MRQARCCLVRLKKVLFSMVVSVLCIAFAHADANANADKKETSDPVTRYSIGLNPYTQDTDWSLRGVDGRRSVVFGVRDDEKIKDLTLDLAYRYSPALLEELSHINVALNGKIVATVPLPKDVDASLKRTQVTLATASLQPYNVLEIQFIGHYTMGCADPLHEDLWAEIDRSSRLQFDVERIALPDDLGMLPIPFFDPKDMRPQKMQVVLQNASDSRLEAAGILASWLGALAQFRDIQFSVHSDHIPKQGHAIVILGHNESLSGLTLPEIQGPTVAVRTNPHDPAGKLLIVLGRNDEEIRRAAVSLALGAQALSGPTALISDLNVAARVPYDAPFWLPTNRPVHLGALAPKQEFSVSGHDPQQIRISLRLPPDLSNWRTKSAPLNLHYRHSAFDPDDQATLNVLINQQGVQEIPLADHSMKLRDFFGADRSVSTRVIDLPLALLESQADLEFKFFYQPNLLKECTGSSLNAQLSAIDPDSTVDFSGIPHHLAMPDLAAFATAGFPFTRMADLSETLVVLPDHSQEHEFAAYLGLLAQMGKSTGYPATGVTLRRNLAQAHDKDLLLIESATPSKTLSDWARYLPRPDLTKNSDSWFAALTNLLPRNPFNSGSASPVSPPKAGIYMAGFESPVTSGRSAVVVAGANGAILDSTIQLVLSDPTQKKRIQGSLVTVQDGSIETLSSETTYYVGQLSVWLATLWFLSEKPFVLFLIFYLGAVLVAVVLYVSLRARARGRLRAESSGTK